MLKIAWAPSYVLPLPPNHRFPMSKYEILPQQLLYEGTIKEENLFTPDVLSNEWITKTHDASYWERVQDLSLSARDIRRIGFPLTTAVVNREAIIAGGTLQCALHALADGISMNIAGGTHHAFANRGEGFCLLNDIAIAARYLLERRLVRKILVVDLDVHQGNGTARLFEDDPRVFTFSMHGANNFPLMKENSDLDIGLADHTDDKFYLDLLDANLKTLIESVMPDFLFYQAGVDILSTDKLGRLGVSRDGCRQRDKLVLSVARANKIPIVVTMGGGYSPDFRDIIEAHANTYRIAQDLWF